MSSKRPKPPSEDDYRKAAIGLAFDYAPSIRACKKCGWPHASGYVCSYCGDNNPTEPAPEAQPASLRG